jgi:hypothetical protein
MVSRPVHSAIQISILAQTFKLALQILKTAKLSIRKISIFSDNN